MKALTRLWALSLLLLAGCASLPDRLTDIHRGMDHQEVKSALGSPQDKTFRGSQEIWTYPGKDGAPLKVIVFEGGKVVELLNAEAAAQALHRLESRDISTHDNKNLRCAGSNDFGKFAEGGGCNLYGCWAAGGYCNRWGCSSSGSCSVRECPDKVASVRCQD